MMMNPTRHRVLMVHNRYQHAGGEDSVVDAELALLKQHGVPVNLYTRHNDEIKTEFSGLGGRLKLMLDTVWSRRTVSDLESILQSFKPTVIHVHNTFPLISASLFEIAARYQVPVVQTLHNFRWFCPQAMLLRDNRPCEACLGGLPWPAVVHACYRESRLQTAVLAGMITWHRWRKTLQTQVARFIALNEFCRDKFIEGGLPADKVVIKPNFVPDVALSSLPAERRGLLFVGRLSPEKGVAVMAEAWRRCSLGQAGQLGYLTVLGDGPERSQCQGIPGLHDRGWQDFKSIIADMHAHIALVMPSLWYENFPRTLVEAFASGLPVIASRLGAMATLIEHGRTGLLFEPGDPDALAQAMTWAMEHPEAMAEMGQNARKVYESSYTDQRNIELIMEIYDQAREQCHV